RLLDGPGPAGRQARGRLRHRPGLAASAGAPAGGCRRSPMRRPGARARKQALTKSRALQFAKNTSARLGALDSAEAGRPFPDAGLPDAAAGAFLSVLRTM